MGTEKRHSPALLTCGILASNQPLFDEVIGLLTSEWGTILLMSDPIPFTFTEYYDEEMGPAIIRSYAGFDVLIEPDAIFSIKRMTNLFENRFLVDGRRQVNLDPGYITLAKLVLATTKDATYRIYGGDGIYAESTLFYKSGTFCPWPWTYPDYREIKTVKFFNELRSLYKAKLRSL